MKIIIIGGRGTAIVIADQMYDAHKRFGMDIEWPPKNLNEMVAEAKKFFNCG